MYLSAGGTAFTLPIGRRVAAGGSPVRAGAGLGQVEPGLGQAESGCPEPVSTAERDRLRNELNRFTKDWMGQKPHGQHWHEGHPDIKRAIEDIIMRMIGITQRPKKLRCSAEMRRRAQRWTSSLHDLLVKVKSGGSTYGGFTKVPQTFKWGFYRGPTYTIRPLSVTSTSTSTAPVSSAPPGSVVVGGQDFPTSQAAQQALAPPTPAAVGQTPSPAVGQPTPAAVGQTLSPAVGLPDELVGVPTNYLLYGGLALAALMFLKK